MSSPSAHPHTGNSPAASTGSGPPSNFPCRYFRQTVRADTARPRLYGTVEVRSPAGNAIAAAYVSLALYRHENISYRPEGRTGLSSQKQSSTTTVGKEILLWQAPEGRSHEDIMSMDIPFMIPFPTDKDALLPATLVRSSRSTTYELVATLHSIHFASERVAIELIMEKFDQLPVWGMFSVPQTLVRPPPFTRASRDSVD